MAFGNVTKKKTSKKVTSKGYAISEDTVQSIFQTWLQSVSFLNNNQEITELKIGEPLMNTEGVVTRWIDIKTKDNKN